MTKQEFVEWIKWQDRKKTLKSDELLAKLDTLIQSEIEAYNAQFEGECLWKKTGNIAGICNKMDNDSHNPHIIYVDDLQEAEQLIGVFTYCPFCGRKIKRT